MSPYAGLRNPLLMLHIYVAVVVVCKYKRRNLCISGPTTVTLYTYREQAATQLRQQDVISYQDTLNCQEKTNVFSSFKAVAAGLLSRLVWHLWDFRFSQQHCQVSSHLGCDAVSLGEQFLMFGKSAVLSPSWSSSPGRLRDPTRELLAQWHRATCQNIWIFSNTWYEIEENLQIGRLESILWYSNSILNSIYITNCRTSPVHNCMLNRSHHGSGS